MQIRVIKRQAVLASVLTALAGSAAAGNFVPRALPTLDEYALFGLAAAVGVAGAIAVFRRRK